MQLEAHETCDFDYLAVRTRWKLKAKISLILKFSTNVQIYNGVSKESPILAKFCNTTHIEPMTTPSNEVMLYFHSDEDSTDTGFQIHYTIVEGIPGCGGTFTDSSGEFASPLKNGVYMKNLICHYVIRLPKDNHIALEFKSFDLEESGTCMFDYVEVCWRRSSKQMVSPCLQLISIFFVDLWRNNRRRSQSWTLVRTQTTTKIWITIKRTFNCL